MDRRSLKREYKETRRPMGVYRVHNRSTDKSLVGSSTDVQSILNRHKAQLGMGMHPNRALQRDWNDLGAGAFVFEVLDTLMPAKDPGYDPAEDLRALEELWLDRLSPFGDRGYNGRPKRGDR